VKKIFNRDGLRFNKIFSTLTHYFLSMTNFYVKRIKKSDRPPWTLSRHIYLGVIISI